MRFDLRQVSGAWGTFRQRLRQVLEQRCTVKGLEDDAKVQVVKLLNHPRFGHRLSGYGAEQYRGSDALRDLQASGLNRLLS